MMHFPLWRICHHFLWGWKILKKVYLRQSKLRYVKKNVVAIHLNGYGLWCFIIHKIGVAFAVAAGFMFSIVAEFSLL